MWMFVEIVFGFVEAGKNLLKRNTTVSKRKTGDPYSKRIVPMADIYISGRAPSTCSV
jgi:hypothetical protein